jgi:hypothetical protein
MSEHAGPGATATGSLQRAVLARTLQHPFTLYPSAVGLLGLVGLVLFGPILPAALAAGAGLSAGLLHFLTQYYLRSDRVAAAHLKEIHDRLEAQQREVLATLEEKLKAAAKQVNAKEYGLQAYDQLGMARTRFELLKNLLGERFKPTELTFSRYFVAGEQTYLAVLDNLDSIASRLQGVSAIDERHITARIAAIGRQKKIAPADEEEIEALKGRLALREAQLERVNTLLTFNESAITEFDRVNNAVTEVRGTRAQASVDLETAIAELEALAARARKLAA